MAVRANSNAEFEPKVPVRVIATNLRSEMMRVFLTDIEREEEPMEIEVLEVNRSTMRVLVPNTNVIFSLKKQDGSSVFKGGIGGRSFEIDARSLTKNKKGSDSNLT
jgi:hypothetical protein